MPTVEDVARDALARVGSDAGLLLAAEWVNRRFKELVSGKKLKHLRKLGELVLPARINDGTVTATRGSKVVTGDATAQAAWSTDVVDRYLRVSVTWYRIAQFQTTQLVLESDFAEDTATDSSYDIVQRFHSLPREVKHLADPLSHQRLHRPIRLISLDRLNLLRSSRTTLGLPRWAAEIGLSDDNTRKLEIYPYPEDDTEIVHYVYWQEPPTLGFREELPGYINSYVLEDGVITDAMLSEGMKLLRDGNPTGGQLLLNESRRQGTLWRGRKLEAFTDEMAFDDTEIAVELFHFTRSDLDIVTAYDQVWRT